MTPTATPARAETAPEAVSPTQAATDSPRAERPLPGATAPRKGVPLLGPLGIKLADRDDVPGEGRPMVFGCHVSRELGRNDGLRLEAELNTAAAAGQELVRAAVAAAVAADPGISALRNRETRLRGSLTNYEAELKTAQRDHGEARLAVSRAIADGSDPAPFETREVAALDSIRQLETRITGTRSALDATAADITRATSAVERSTCARLRGQAEQELERLGLEVAGALFERLHRLTTLRAAAAAAAR